MELACPSFHTDIQQNDTKTFPEKSSCIDTCNSNSSSVVIDPAVLAHNEHIDGHTDRYASEYIWVNGCICLLSSRVCLLFALCILSVLLCVFMVRMINIKIQVMCSRARMLFFALSLTRMRTLNVFPLPASLSRKCVLFSPSLPPSLSPSIPPFLALFHSRPSLFYSQPPSPAPFQSF